MTVTREKIRSWCEKKSKENLVCMYRAELLRIAKGERCFALIPRGARKKLRRDGVLQKNGNRYSVTDLGIKMIREGTFSKEGLNAEM